MAVIEKLSELVFKIEKLIAIALLSIMFISITLGVIYRYYLNAPILGSDEIAIFSLIWLSFIGGSMSIKEQRSAAVTFLIDKIKGKMQRTLISIGLVILVSFVAYMLNISIQWILSPNIAVQKSVSLKIPMIYAYLSVPVGFTFMTIHALALCTKSLKELIGRG